MEKVVLIDAVFADRIEFLFCFVLFEVILFDRILRLLLFSSVVLFDYNHSSSGIRIC
jgi:hypothetical protein